MKDALPINFMSVEHVGSRLNGELICDSPGIFLAFFFFNRMAVMEGVPAETFQFFPSMISHLLLVRASIKAP